MLKLDRFKTGFKIAVKNGLENRVTIFMVVNKGCYGYYIIQSSNKNLIEAYGRIKSTSTITSTS